MSGDYSRIRFDPRKHFTNVLMQQGRVQLDSDWNEMVDIFDRRFRAERVDSFGRAAVPRRTPDAFLCTYTPGNPGAMTLGTGRLYVDGLLAENHGAANLQTFDPILHEQRGQGATDYFSGQPYASAAVVGRPPNAGPFLAYLDVWQREVTFTEDPTLVEPALGVDTTTRQQTAWRVRIVTGPDVAAQPAADAFDHPVNPPPAFWSALTAPPAGRLSNATDNAPVDNADPCIIPPGGGYRSLQNQLYRVEVHTSGAAGTARFKWSRDNAGVTAQVTAITDLKFIEVASIGRDSVARFARGQWLEILDDDLEAAGGAGDMRMIASVDDETRTIELATPLPANRFAPDAAGLRARRTRVRRWDQSGVVRDNQNNVLVNLDDPNSGGTIPLPAAANPARSVFLESGVRITFTVDAAPGLDATTPFRAGDFWVFAARSATATIDPLDRAPPRGAHHHYAPLAWFAANGARVDLRRLWPPAPAGTGTIFVGAREHRDGSFTIQAAINQLLPTGGTIVLGAGVYPILASALQVVGGRGIQIQGQGASTVLVRQTLATYVARVQPNPLPAVEIDDLGAADASSRSLLRVQDTVGFGLTDLVLVGSAASASGAPLLSASNVAGLEIERCYFVQTGHGVTHSPAIVLSGAILGATLRDSVILSKSGIGAGSRLFTADLRIEDNTFSCQHRGIDLGGLAVFAQVTRIAGNSFACCSSFAVRVGGVVHTGRAVEIDGNTFDGLGGAIQTSATSTTITRNTLRGPYGRRPLTGLAVEDNDYVADTQNLAGISATENPHIPASEALVVDGNTIRGYSVGVSIAAPARLISIRDNQVAECGQYGIAVQIPDHAAFNSTVEVRGNIVRDIFDRLNSVVSAIAVQQAGDVTIADNTITNISFVTDTRPTQSYIRGIDAIRNVNTTIRGNNLRNVGPPGTAVNEPETSVIVCSWNMARALIVNNREDHEPNSSPASGIVALNYQMVSSGPVVLRADNIALFVADSRVIAFPPVRRHLQVEGNHLHAVYGRYFSMPAPPTISSFPALLVTAANGNVFFTNNVVTVLGTQLGVVNPEAQVGQLNGGNNMSVVVGGNSIIRVTPSGPALPLFITAGYWLVHTNFAPAVRIAVNGSFLAPGGNSNYIFP